MYRTIVERIGEKGLLRFHVIKQDEEEYEYYVISNAPAA